MKWKPISIAFILALSAFFGIFGFYGTETATGTVVGGNISVDTVWDLARSPFIVMENVIVDPGVTLTVEPGVEVKFDPPGLHDYLSIYIEGTLYSVGDPGSTILFTSNSPTPQVVDWYHVQVNSSGYAKVTHSKFEYGSTCFWAYSSNNTITNNHFSKGNQGIDLRSSTGNYVANNTAEDIGGFFATDSSSFNTVVNNTIKNVDWPIYLHTSSYNLVHGNHIENSKRGIELAWYSGNNTVVNNTIVNATIAAIYLGDAWKDVIENNTITESRRGIWISTSPKTSNLTVANNTISECEFGIRAGHGARHGTIISNKVRYNMKGIYLGFNVKFDSNSTIRQNDIVSNSVYGMLLENVSGTLIYHNNFISNTIQGINDNGTNSWDNGYPSGGNYWSDYQGNDTFNGPNQDIPGSDGIGDTPYAVNPNGTDRYPLTEPNRGNLPPRNLNAYLTGTNFKNVTLTWNLSWNDGQRANDVTGYEIYKSSTYDNERMGYSLMSSTPNQTAQYVYSYSGEGDPNNYFYYVCAINGTGNSSCSSDQAGKFTRPLSVGPNLVSIPLIQSDDTIQTVLQTLSYDKAWSYDPINQEWRSFSESKPYAQSLEYLNHTMGIWVNVTQDSNLTVAGVVPVSTTIDLQAGWNLVGFPSFDDNFTVADLKTVVAVERIEGIDGLAPPYFLRVMTDGDLLHAGLGYWIKVESPTVWTVQNL